MIEETSKPDKDFPEYGSRAWANFILKEGIKVLQDWDRDKGARVCEVLCYISMLRSARFYWQSKILRNWLHFYWSRLRAEGPTPEVVGGASL